MAKIVKSDSGYWLGKELYKGESYMAFGANLLYCSTKDIVIVDFAQLAKDLKEHLDILVSPKTPSATVKILARELCSSEHGMLYLIDNKAKFGVRKIIGTPKNHK